MAKIDGGAVIWARKTINSGIFTDKPDKWFKIWFYLVMRVYHSDNERLSSGQRYFKYEWIREATRATRAQVDHFIRWAKKEQMLATTKATHGMVVTILKYDYYQLLDNYRSDNKSDIKATQKRHRSDNILKNDKECKECKVKDSLFEQDSNEYRLASYL